MTDGDLSHLGRAELLERLTRWNRRLLDKGAEPVISVAEADDLDDRRLRRAVTETIDHLLDIIAAERARVRL
jgi:hypothetical protein